MPPLCVLPSEILCEWLVDALGVGFRCCVVSYCGRGSVSKIAQACSLGKLHGHHLYSVTDCSGPSEHTDSRRVTAQKTPLICDKVPAYRFVCLRWYFFQTFPDRFYCLRHLLLSSCDFFLDFANFIGAFISCACSTLRRFFGNFARA